MINLIIVDDEILIRDGLKILLSSYEDINVVGLCQDGEQALTMCSQHEIDVVLLDIRMPKCDGVEATKLIKQYDDNIKILILTTFNDQEYIYNALTFGASGYLLKDSSSEKIYEAIKGVYAGNVVIHPEIVDQMINNKESKKDSSEVVKEYNLTDKEIYLIKLIAKGMTNEEISKEMFLAKGTVKNNISLILSKLALRDRTQIAIFAHKNNIINDFS